MAHKNRYSFPTLIITLILVVFTPATGQYKDQLGGNWANPASATITNIIMDRYARKRLEKNLAAKRAGANSIRSSPNASMVRTNDQALHFRPTGTQLKTREIANLIDAGNPQVLALMTALLNEYEKSASTAGKPNDLALALSFFFATNASIFHDAGQPSDARILELRETIAGALVEGNGLQAVSDRQKQEMYETLVLFTGFALAAYQEGKQNGNSESVRVAQQLAGQNLVAVTGIAPDKINFDEQGLSIDREPVAESPPPAASETPSTTLAERQLTAIHAGKLVMEFEGNEVRALQMYGGKRVRVNGTVNSIDTLKDGRITLTFHSPAAGYSHARCYFNKSQSARLAQLSGGQEAVVEGTVRGFSDGLKSYVDLENCVVP